VKRPALQAGRSLTGHLMAWVLAALLLVWGSFIAVGYQTGEHEADELTDGHLATVSALLLAFGGWEGGSAAAPQRPPGQPRLRAHDYQHSLSVTVWDAQGRLLANSGDAPVPSFQTPEGFADLRLGQPAQSWRGFTRWNDAHDRKVTVMLSAAERDALAADIAEQVTEPGLWLLPAIALVLGFAIHRGLRPLRRLAHEVHALDIHAAQALPADARYEELQAAETAINRLMERYHAALSRERGLANEFAHELRTPLASLALQARGLRDALPADASGRESLLRLEADALRAGHVLDHLLALARASRAEMDEALEPFDLAEVARQVVAEAAPAADAARHDLGLRADAPFRLRGHPVLLGIALRNLVENAVVHTPPGTRVEVELDAAARIVQVRDDGALQARADPATGAPRALGLGLGHRVVEKVAAIHGATFESAGPGPDGWRTARMRFAAPGRGEPAVGPLADQA